MEEILGEAVVMETVAGVAIGKAGDVDAPVVMTTTVEVLFDVDVSMVTFGTAG